MPLGHCARTGGAYTTGEVVARKRARVTVDLWKNDWMCGSVDETMKTPNHSLQSSWAKPTHLLQYTCDGSLSPSIFLWKPSSNHQQEIHSPNGSVLPTKRSSPLSSSPIMLVQLLQSTGSDGRRGYPISAEALGHGVRCIFFLSPQC